MGRIKDLLRHPRTLQEKKANQVWPVRGRRKPKHLVCAWDDIWRSDLGDRCWKRYRKTQYRGGSREGSRRP